jgi:hypothetical protein
LSVRILAASVPHEHACTTGNGYFAECKKHSAKLKKHSAKALQSVALGKGHTEERLSAKGTLPSAFRRALGKTFAERKAPRSANFKRRDGTGNMTADLPSARIWHSAKTVTLPSVRCPALGKVTAFAECREHGTRQRFFGLCRVFTRGKDSSLFAECLHSAKILHISHFNLFFRFHPHIYIYIRKTLYHHKDHQYHIYITNITSILQTQLIHIHIPKHN